MQTSNLNLFQVNTTAYDEEDFLLLTSLTEEQITKVIKPIVDDERENEVEYDNETLVDALIREYPHHVVSHYSTSGIDLISI